MKYDIGYISNYLTEKFGFDHPYEICVDVVGNLFMIYLIDTRYPSTVENHYPRNSDDYFVEGAGESVYKAFDDFRERLEKFLPREVCECCGREIDRKE